MAKNNKSSSAQTHDESNSENLNTPEEDVQSSNGTDAETSVDDGGTESPDQVADSSPGEQVPENSGNAEEPEIPDEPEKSDQAKESKNSKQNETGKGKTSDTKDDSLNEKYVRLLAEYDNYRKRSVKEKESAWTDAKSSTAAEFFIVYDNLERALKAPCSDEAFLKGVEMTMKSMKDVLAKLGIEEIPALGEQFNPELHNAVMHVEDENVGENTIVEVFQTGFRCGDKVIRFSMVKVAN